VALPKQLISIRDPRKERIFFIVLACVVFPAVAILSFLPEADKTALHTRGRFHSLGHFLIFSFVAFVAGRTSRSVQTRILLFVGALVFGFGIEFVEHYIYQAAIEWPDVLVDFVGVIGGTLVALVSAPKVDRQIL
jgi:hypothetical protein